MAPQTRSKTTKLNQLDPRLHNFLNPDQQTEFSPRLTRSMATKLNAMGIAIPTVSTNQPARIKRRRRTAPVRQAKSGRLTNPGRRTNRSVSVSQGKIPLFFLF